LTAPSACLIDRRQLGKVQHELTELLRQRACGYADCNDATRLADGAIHKLPLKRDSLVGPVLASQPALSRFENVIGGCPVAVHRMAVGQSGRRACGATLR
jgi:hypothetical protein